MSDSAMLFISETFRLMAIFAIASAAGAMLFMGVSTLSKLRTRQPAICIDQEWREAVQDRMAILHMTPSDDPLESVNRLVSMEISIALNPLVSSAAASLVERGKYLQRMDDKSFMHNTNSMTPRDEAAWRNAMDMTNSK